ncbi:Protein translocase subunit SecF [Candidatus Xenohaliotis californiensis]|uniref:Protein-export membrane protein SecF n=1 Tax=Candidatus Xenohaliotis californiensis TaxID=84677 RepID=A0ABP0EUK8_9RICK|nr:Protein translocase subunit SecF [Candidatus Xenohaliotis californiensis]
MINFSKFSKQIIIANYICIIFILGLVFIHGINMGIDFTGGITIELSSTDTIELSHMKQIMPKNFSIQNITDDKHVLIHLKAQPDTNIDLLIKNVKHNLENTYNNISYQRIEYVGPSIGRDLMFSGIVALFCAMFGMFIYLTIRFNLYFAIGGIQALFNDIITIIGFFSISNIEFGAPSIAALLTIIGYSINDSVVIFDRIRENLKKRHKNTMEIINDSLNSTLKRTMLTSLTTLFAVAVLIFFTHGTISNFSWPMFVGIITGTFSSVFIAPLIPIKCSINSKNTLKTDNIN